MATFFRLIRLFDLVTACVSFFFLDSRMALRKIDSTRISPMIRCLLLRFVFSTTFTNVSHSFPSLVGDFERGTYMHTHTHTCTHSFSLPLFICNSKCAAIYAQLIGLPCFHLNILYGVMSFCRSKQRKHTDTLIHTQQQQQSTQYRQLKQPSLSRLTMIRDILNESAQQFDRTRIYNIHTYLLKCSLLMFVYKLNQFRECEHIYIYRKLSLRDAIGES